MLTLVTEDDQVLGPVPRRLVHGNPSLVHRSTHVLVLWEGRLLLQKRSATKDTEPGKWDTSVGGHVGFGQGYEEAAIREAAEELGIRIESLEILYASRFRSAGESENVSTYLHLCEGPFRPDPGEIDAIRFWTRQEIEAALGTGIFTPNFELEYARFLACSRGNLLR